jgi:hypothetical protein
VFNSIRIWFAPNASIQAGQSRSLAEDPCPKDKWYSTSDIMAFAYPPLPDDQIREEPTILFGQGSRIQERYDDPEVQGGKIALIAFKQNKVQKPPNGLDRMHATFLKQVAYNDRVIEAEKEVSSVNCDIADFLSGMTFDPDDQVVICVNGSEEMKRDEEAVGGQLWMQGDRRMTASNHVLDGMVNSREAAILSAAAEAVAWKHASELDGEPRKGQRVVIYPKDLSQLETVLSTGNPNIDSEDGHPIAYSAILQAAQSYERPPLFLREDHEQITSDPVMTEKVPGWMNTAAKVATGNRRRVLENGPDVMNSDDEDALEDVKPDEEKGMYTAGMDPEKGPVKLAQAQAAAQRAAAKAPPRPQTPSSGSSDDDDPNGSGYVWSQTKSCMRKNKHFRNAATDATKTSGSPPVDVPKPVPAVSAPMSVPADSVKGKKPVMKAAASQKAPVGQPISEAKASKPVKGQESPETKVSKPMETRRRTASRAGGLRSGGGSGKTDTCVAQGNPSKT